MLCKLAKFGYRVKLSGPAQIWNQAADQTSAGERVRQGLETDNTTTDGTVHEDMG